MPKILFQKGHKINLGRKMPIKTKKAIKIANLGNQYRKGMKSPFKGRKLSEKSKEMIRIGCRKAAYRVYERIEKEIPKLEKHGFRCIPIGRVIPDIIAIKNDKIYAIEVEYGNPNYSKYTKEIRKYYDDIIWIIKKNAN